VGFLLRSGNKVTEIRREEDTLRELFAVVKNAGFVCGGFARYALSPVKNPAPASDIDVYPYSQNSYLELESKCKLHYGEFRETPRTLTFEKAGPDNRTIQLIKPLHEYTMGIPEEVLKYFDFSVCRAAIWKEGSKLRHIADPDFEQHEIEKQLVIRNIACPLGVFRRIVKYTRKKYRIKTPEMFKVLVAWESMSPEQKYKLNNIVQEIAKNPSDVGHFYNLLAFID